ncbi:MAG: DUF2062 domain-containing protein [Candidatus Omnitrophota bacterium]
MDNIKKVCLKLFRTNDSAQKIAIGFGLGVFLGILPGTGPLASLFVATLLKVNRAAAFVGSLLVNTWLNIITFLLSIQIGSAIMQLHWQDVYDGWSIFIKNFKWRNLFELPLLKFILPVILGYFVIGLALGALSYLTILVIMKLRRQNGKIYKRNADRK